LPEIEEISLFTAVHGPICESTDALGEHDLPPLRRGDLVAIRDAGAYAASLSSTYNGRPRAPQVILTTDGRLVLARRRGSVAGLG
jgi:diaminopimelate decarboxylase